MIDTAAIETNVRRGHELAAGLSADQFSRRPGRNAWSIGECLAHLNATNEQYVKILSAGVASGKAAGRRAPGPFRLTAIERMFVWLLGPPARMKFKAPALFLPEGGLHKEQILAEWDATHAELLRLARDAEGLDLKAIRVSSPASERMKISLLAAFAGIEAHDRRHLWQAGRIRAKLPAAASMGASRGSRL